MRIRSFVLDASVTLAWAFDDEKNPVADQAEALLRTGSASAIVPDLWWYEVRNILLVGERRKRITAAGSALFLNQLALINVEMDSSRTEHPMLELARRHLITVYDAAYLALAVRRSVPLATQDNKLAGAALAEGVPLLK